MLDNYVNGNLTDAKRQAKRYSFPKIRAALQQRGYTTEAADAVALYLKGYGSFQKAADAESVQKQKGGA